MVVSFLEACVVECIALGLSDRKERGDLLTFWHLCSCVCGCLFGLDRCRRCQLGGDPFTNEGCCMVICADRHSGRFTGLLKFKSETKLDCLVDDDQNSIGV